MERLVSIQNESIEMAGYKKDYKASIIEYIWNSLEAGASTVDINIVCNEMNGVKKIEIKDNGLGIDYDTLDDTFGTFLYSKKNAIAESIRGRINKGKGRYSFLAVSNQARWDTFFQKDGKVYNYSIVIDSSSKNRYLISDLVEMNNETITGTKIVMNGNISLLKDDFAGEFIDVLLGEFAWFLYLNRNKEFYISLNGEKLNYDKYIDMDISDERKIEIDGYTFNVSFIKWREGISQKYFYYFLDPLFVEKHKQHTSFNNNAIGFFHSVYIISDYFEGFISTEAQKEQISLFGKSVSDNTYKLLLKELKEIMLYKQKQFIKNDLPKVIKDFESEGVFPKFKNDIYDQIKKQDLIKVIKEVYCIQPKIFYKAPTEQKKSVIGFLNLLLDTEERENIITIIESITELTSDERASLANVLKKTKLSKIIATVKMIENRYLVVELLKKLVYDNTKFTSERMHIQGAIEENYWLFGEQYNLVSADDSFEKALTEYRKRVDKQTQLNVIENEQRLRRPDIFICRSRILEDNNETQLEENIIVELKSPSIMLTTAVYRQIEDYMSLISKEGQFNSQLRIWKFIVICVDISEEVKDKYEAFNDKGRRFLVYKQRNFEIYAMTWDDLFKGFDIRHKHLLDKLQYNKSRLLKELELKVNSEGREACNDISKAISDIFIEESVVQ